MGGGGGGVCRAPFDLSGATNGNQSLAAEVVGQNVTLTSAVWCAREARKNHGYVMTHEEITHVLVEL